MSIDVSKLPKEIRDVIELKELTDQTFSRFVDEEYSEIWWNLLSERADPGVEHSMLASVTGLQGCYAKGTLITTEHGLKRIEDVVAGDRVWSGGEWRRCVPVRKGLQKVMDVYLRNRQVLHMTRDHVMLTKSGWKRADELIVGDEFVLGGVPWSSVWNEDSERAAVIGMLLADGHLDEMQRVEKYAYVRKSTYALKRVPKKEHVWMKKRIRFYKKDMSLQKKMSLWLKKYYGAVATGGYDDVFNGDFRTRVMCIQNEVVFDNLVASGMGKKAEKVVIPDWILRSDAAMNGFLAGYFAGDGSFYDGTLEISTVSRGLADQLVAWLQSRSVLVNVVIKAASGKNQEKYRVLLREKSALKQWCLCVPNISDVKKAMVSEKRDCLRRKRRISFPVVERFLQGDVCEVFDLHVEGVHEYLANGLVSHNSGKSMTAIAMCCFMDPDFSVDKIFFSYEELVNKRHLLKSNTAVLVDEQSELFGLDSHRVSIILQNLKEQLRKKSIHFFFCSPTLYPESQTSMYIIETIFIDYEEQECYAALKTRDGLTLGNIRIPYPLKVLEDGNSLASQELIDAYQKKKDAHLEKVLGKSNMDTYEVWAKGVMEDPFFKKMEVLYVRKMGYVPQNTLVQVINKLHPEFNAGVVVLEIAGRIKLEKEMSGKWEIAGKSVSRKDRGK